MVGGRFYINHPDRDQSPSTMAIDPLSINQLDPKPSRAPHRTCSLTHGMPEILAWQSEPELQVLCSPTGELKLRGVEIATWQAIELPRAASR